jgi:hypothetical protein
MAFTRIRTIKGRDYRYLEERWREGGKVCSRSTSLGPVGGTVRRKGVLARMGEFITTNLQHEHVHVFDMDAFAREEQEREQQKAAAVAAGIADLHERYGLILGPRNPVPIEKVPRGGAQLAVPNPEAPEKEARQQDAPSEVSDGAEGQ